MRATFSKEISWIAGGSYIMGSYLSLLFNKLGLRIVLIAESPV